jgi:Zn-dependent membrane protease YugP
MQRWTDGYAPSRPVLFCSQEVTAAAAAAATAAAAAAAAAAVDDDDSATVARVRVLRHIALTGHNRRRARILLGCCAPSARSGLQQLRRYNST